MPLINTRITALTQAARQLINRVDAKLDALEDGGNVPTNDPQLTELEARIAMLEAAAAQVFESRPTFNLLADSGRFAGNDDAFDQFVLNGFTAPSYFSSANGASAPIEAGYYRYDARDLGGAVTAPIAQSVIDLATAMPGGPHATLMEFYVAEITAGTGTTLPTSLAPDLYNIGNKAVYGTGLDNSFTRAFWVRALDGDVAFAPDSDTLPRFNGVDSTDGVLTSPNWTHVSITEHNFNGFSFDWPNIYMSPGHRIEIALPVLTPGRVTGIHTSPVPFIGAIRVE